jgi:serine/threonine protein kinase
MPLAPGARLGPYEIVAPIGAGGMGEVYKAHDARLHRTVAIKVLGGHMAGPDALQRFEQESRAASALNHPNILTIHDVGHEGDVVYFAMEWVDGRTLREMLAARRLRRRRLRRRSKTTRNRSSGAIRRCRPTWRRSWRAAWRRTPAIATSPPAISRGI